jgi:pectate lyase
MWPFTVSSPLPDQSAKDAYGNVLKYAGAIVPKRDKVDERIINEAKNGTAIGKGVFGKPGIIDLPIVVGGWPEYRSSPAPIDTEKMECRMNGKKRMD